MSVAAGKLSGIVALTETLSIRTPENVEFQFELAGIAARCAAWLIDVAIMGAIITLASCLIGQAIPIQGLASALIFIVAFLVQWWYGALLEWGWRGQTVGKRALRIRVIGRDGLRIGFPQAVVRNLLRAVDALPFAYLVGGLSACIDSERRRLGDFAAHTVVIYERILPKPAGILPPEMRYNSFQDDPNVAMAARRVTAPERDAMIALGTRRDALPIGTRLELFTSLAEHLERRLGVRRPPGISAEKYVLNLTAVVLERASRMNDSRTPR